MNWFAGLLANIVNTLADGIGGLLNAATGTRGLTNTAMGNVILHGFFPFEPLNRYPSWGEGNFANLIDGHSVAVLRGFAVAFEAFGWAFFLAAIYVLVVQVAGAGESAVQRERLKKGVVHLFVAAILISVGSHFAVLITQLFFYLSDYAINLHPIQTFTSLSTAGNQALLNAIVNLIQSVLSIVVWIVYQFRLLFLYLWMLFFPLAMAFYANDKTRGIAKMWWTEWIYQMAVPFGQALVYGVASAVASPSKSGAALTASDVFVALSGTIGLLLSATYVRKLIDLVAQNFGTSSIGASHGTGWGMMAMAGGAALTMDVAGKAAVHGTHVAAKHTVGRGIQTLDRRIFQGKAEQSIRERGETHAGAIQSGATAEEVMMHATGTGAQMHAQGAGLEAAASSGGKSTPGRTTSKTSASGGGGGRHPLKPLMQSRTFGALQQAHRSVQGGIQQSHLGTMMGTRLAAWQHDGGLSGSIHRRISPKVLAGLSHETVGRIPGAARMSGMVQKSALEQQHRQDKMQALRTHLTEVLAQNDAAHRLPAMAHLYDEEHHTFHPTPAQEAYTHARQALVTELQHSGMGTAEAAAYVGQAETRWQSGKHPRGVPSQPLAVQAAYRHAYQAYRPAQQDTKAQRLVVEGKVTMPSVRDPAKQHKAMTHAYLQEARNAVAYKR
jgi:hypothetical protein